MLYERYHYYRAPVAAASGGVAVPVARLDAAASGTAATLSYAVSAGDDRCLIIGVTQEVTASSDCTVDYGGQAATQIASIVTGATTHCRVQLFRVMEAGIAAASGSTITATGVAGVYTVHAASYENVDQADPVSGFDTDSVDAATPNPLDACDITVPSDGLGVAIAGQGGADAASWANLTEQTDTQSGSHRGSFADTLTPGATSVDCTWTNQVRAAIVAASLNPATTAGSGPSYPPSSSTFYDVVAGLTPTAWWRHGESSGTTVVDAQGVQSGTYYGSPTLGVAGYAAGNTGITLNGTDQYADIPDNAAWDVGTSDFSIMFAFSLPAWPSAAHMTPFTRGNGAGTGDYWVYFNLDWPSTRRITVRVAGTYYDLDTNTTLEGTGWHLCGLSFDRDGNLTCYIDGTSVATDDISGQAATNLTGTRRIGLGHTVDPSASDYLNGSLDEVAIWNGTLLSAADWAAIHAARSA